MFEVINYAMDWEEPANLIIYELITYFVMHLIS